MDTSSTVRPYRIGVDIGGTFTDFLLLDDRDGSIAIGKTLTTPDAPARAVIDGITELLASNGVRADQISQVVHGTTLVTNALIERKGATTGLLTTKGFRDAVEIGREHRYDLYDLFIDLPEPLVPRDRRLELDERMLSDGSVLTELSDDDVLTQVDRLRADGVEAVAVSLLHSYQNPAHEQRVGALLTEHAPDLIVSLSSDVVPEIREFERASTTIANVYARPVVSRYLKDLESSLRVLGLEAPLFIMLSSGGLSTVETAERFPIRLIESGPAAGALAAAHSGRQTGRPSLLSFDMGGTTAKACLIDDGQPLLSPEFEVNRVYRFKKGSGLPIRVPVIELIEIGAGGGSIARMDSLGLLKVGPDSAGAVPGPACYGRGGQLPTVTDADLLLGYLDPDFFLGGTMQLDRSAAESALGRLGDQFGASALGAAWGVHQVVNEQMAAAARMHAIEQGKDPRDYPMFAFGGAGPVHAFHVAQILGCPEVIVPFGAGVGSTIGFLVAPFAFDFVRSYVGKLRTLDWSEVNRRYAEMEADGRAVLSTVASNTRDITIERFAELRYVGQGHEVQVAIPSGELSPAHADEIEATFDSEYRRLYGRTATGNPLEAMTWRVVATLPNAAAPTAATADSTTPAGEPMADRNREMYLPESDAMEAVPVYRRASLERGATVQGPAIIEERESTVIVGAAGRATVDVHRNIVITIEG